MVKSFIPLIGALKVFDTPFVGRNERHYFPSRSWWQHCIASFGPMWDPPGDCDCGLYGAHHCSISSNTQPPVGWLYHYCCYSKCREYIYIYIIYIWRHDPGHWCLLIDLVIVRHRIRFWGGGVRKWCRETQLLSLCRRAGCRDALFLRHVLCMGDSRGPCENIRCLFTASDNRCQILAGSSLDFNYYSSSLHHQREHFAVYRMSPHSSHVGDSRRCSMLDPCTNAYMGVCVLK